MTILDTPVISRIRRNHGLEHASIHLLSRRYPGRNFAGHSDSGGFWLWGNVSTEEMADAVTEALARLRSGERELAVHPNCGTNFVTYGMAAGLGSFLAMWGVGRRFRDKVERFPLVAAFATVGLILAQPLGYRLQQRVTTSGDPGDLEIIDVIRSENGSLVGHRVTTKG
jgi:hypothetical protein